MIGYMEWGLNYGESLDEVYRWARWQMYHVTESNDLDCGYGMVCGLWARKERIGSCSSITIHWISDPWQTARKVWPRHQLISKPRALKLSILFYANQHSHGTNDRGFQKADRIHPDHKKLYGYSSHIITNLNVAEYRIRLLVLIRNSGRKGEEENMGQEDQENRLAETATLATRKDCILQ